MNDPITLDDLSAYLDDELPPGRRTAVEAALARDGRLREALDALAWTAGVVASAPLPDVPVGGALRLPEGERRAASGGAWARSRWRTPAALAAAVALAAIGAASWLGGPGGASREAAAPIQSATGVEPAAGQRTGTADAEAEAGAPQGAAGRAAPTAAGGDQAVPSPAASSAPPDGGPGAGRRLAAAALAAVAAALAARAALAGARAAGRARGGR